MTAGGIIPDDDVPALREAGVSAVFGPGTTIAEVADVPAGQRPTARRSVPAVPMPAVPHRHPAVRRAREGPSSPRRRQRATGSPSPGS